MLPSRSDQLAQYTSQDFDNQKNDFPDAEMDSAGIQPATLAAQPALRFDFFYTYQGVRYHNQETDALVGGLLYMLTLLVPDTAFDTRRDEINAITDSFRFTTRSMEAGVYSDPMARFTFAVPPGFDLVSNPIETLRDNQISLATLSPNPVTGTSTDPVMIVQSYPDTMTFDDRFNVYANAGVNTLVKNGRELSAGGVRRITLDSHPAGLMDYYQPTTGGIRTHVYQAFTVLNGTQYYVAFNFYEDDGNDSAKVVDAVLSSFHFQA